MRSLSPSFVVAPPTGAKVRTRLRLSPADEKVLRQVGEYLGGLAGADLAVRSRLRRGPDGRAGRKRALTAASSSRWAGAITRTANDQWTRGYMNLQQERASLQRAIHRLRQRIQAPVGGKADRVRGYATPGERWAKQRRLQTLSTRLARVGPGPFGAAHQQEVDADASGTVAVEAVGGRSAAARPAPYFQ